MLAPSILGLSWLASLVEASVTVYNQSPYRDATASASAAAANYTGAAAYDPTVLNPPPIPSDTPMAFNIQLHTTPGAVQGLSIPHSGDFFGFSIEFSVITQVSE